MPSHREWFATYGPALRGGRDFEARDTPRAPPVAIVSDAFARRFLPGRSAIGERVALSLGGRPMRRTIVGVVSDAVQGSLRREPPPTLYLPLAQWDFPVPMLPRFLIDRSARPSDRRRRSRAASRPR